MGFGITDLVSDVLRPVQTEPAQPMFHLPGNRSQEAIHDDTDLLSSILPPVLVALLPHDLADIAFTGIAPHHVLLEHLPGIEIEQLSDLVQPLPPDDVRSNESQLDMDTVELSRDPA